MVLLTILIIITIITICNIVIGFATDNKDVGAFFVIILLYVILIGWGALGNILAQKSKYVDIENVVVIKTPSILIAEWKDQREIIKDIKTYNSVDSLTKWKYKIEYNMYGGECRFALIPIFE